MRFAVAVAFLGQTLLPAPIESETAFPPTKNERQRLTSGLLVAGETTHGAHGLLQQRTFTGGRGSGLGAGIQTFEMINANKFKAGGMLKNKSRRASQEDKKECDPKSDDPDIGILSCGLDKRCVESNGSLLGGQCMDPIRSKTRGSPFGGNRVRSRVALRGKLKNIKLATKKECDPNDEDEVSCGVGRYCKENEEPFLGGFCAGLAAELESKEVSRRTQYYVDEGDDSLIPADLCSFADVFGCDCSEVDIMSGSGYLTCIPLESMCLPCDDICVSFSARYSFTGNATDTSEICYHFSSPYERKACYYGDFRGPDATCIYSIDDLTCDLCVVREDGFKDFKCTNTIPEAKAGITSDHVYPLPILKAFFASDADPTSCLNANKTIGGPLSTLTVDRGPPDGALQMPLKSSQIAVVCALTGAFLSYFL